MMMGTEIFLFGPNGAEKMEIKDFYLHSEIMSRTTFLAPTGAQGVKLSSVRPCVRPAHSSRKH